MENRDVVLNEVTRVLREELMFDGKVDRSVSMESIGLDSIQMMQLFVYLEEAFSFEFAADADFKATMNGTVDAFVDLALRSMDAHQQMSA